MTAAEKIVIAKEKNSKAAKQSKSLERKLTKLADEKSKLGREARQLGHLKGKEIIDKVARERNRQQSKVLVKVKQQEELMRKEQ